MSDNTDEIDLIELLKKIYFEKKFILKISILATLFGVVYALFQPNEFTSSTTFIPQLSSGVKTGGSSLSGLASLAGINIGSMESSSEFPPTLYPQVVNGIPFKTDLLSSEIKIENNIVTVRDYFSNKSSFDFLGTIKKYTIGLPSLILSSLKNKNEIDIELNTNSNLFVVNEDDESLFNNISDALSLSVNKKEGFITISFSDSNKYVAAQITQISQIILQDKIMDFKNKSSKEMLNFTLKQYNEKKDLYENLQDRRAIFVDKNINISSTLFQNKLSRIESELSILQSVVQQLASQVEQAKLQLNKDTPVFTIINPVTIPFTKSAPQRSVIVISFFMIGFIFSCLYILTKDLLIDFLKTLKS